MVWDKPSPTAVWRAIDIYMAHAYEGAAPSAVRARLRSLQAAPPAELFDSPVFERDTAHPPAWFCLRLGNRLYPHMKLCIERCPDGNGYLLRADTHDRHIAASPNAKDRHQFQELMAKNHTVATAIEREWGEKGLPVFTDFLRNDLLRRGHGACTYTSSGDTAHPKPSSLEKAGAETRTPKPDEPTMPM